jgi:hypothetical protein
MITLSQHISTAFNFKHYYDDHNLITYDISSNLYLVMPADVDYRSEVGHVPYS